MRIIARQVPNLITLGALIVIIGLIVFHGLDAVEPAPESRTELPPLAPMMPPAPLPAEIDGDGCRVLPDDLRICDVRQAEAVSPTPARGLRFSKVTTAERPPRPEALRVVDWIVRVAGVARNFEVVEADFKRSSIAFAAVREDRRFIVYDARMFDWGDGRVRWRHVAIMAHEIAHHLNGDTTDSQGAVHSHERELTADHFAGFVVARLGGTLNQAVAMTEIFSEQGSPSHPPRNDRIKAIAKGWQAAQATTDLLRGSDGPGGKALHPAQACY